jgi:lipopolysaccharide transport system ATP-binding protein
MSDVGIRVENLSKCYTIGTRNRKHDTLRDHLSEAVKSVFRHNGRDSSGTHTSSTIWALKDISFDIKQGEIVGIIGPNGAGKSTLLKILSRITEPTYGFAEIRGRVGSLLEVGTGFHPELTGKENIYLNGAILGMKRAEVDHRFDEIVAFAEVEKFIDTPVKHYSSGMFMRLAFAVAAHLEPEILIVDEVLAVGDAAFQKKCLGRMGAVARDGRTVVFVSHNMAAIENICSKGLVLQAGQLAFAGTSKQATDFYLQDVFSRLTETSNQPVIDLSNVSGRSAGSRSLLKKLELFCDGGEPLNGGLKMGNSFSARIHFKLEEPTARFGAGLGFEDLRGQRLFTAHTDFQPNRNEGIRAGHQSFVCNIPSLPLVPGDYNIIVWLDIGNKAVDVVKDAARLTIMDSNFYGSGKVPWNGFFALKHQWQLL